jgi:peptidoglycan-associated lipoprotein
MKLVGRADPRGDDEYNYVLGLRRADGVEGALAGSARQDDDDLRGRQRRDGLGRTGWPRDRRVDVLLAQ